MSEHNPTDTQVDPTADYESALDTEQTEAKSNITITEAAQGYLADLLAKQDTDGIGVRIFVEHPGTPRAECCMAYNQPGEEDSADLKLTYDDFSAFIEAASVPYTLGADSINGYGNIRHILPIIKNRTFRSILLASVAIKSTFLNTIRIYITLFNKTAVEVFMQIPLIPLIHGVMVFIDGSQFEFSGRYIAK